MRSNAIVQARLLTTSLEIFPVSTDKPVAEITNEDVIIYNNDHILKNNLSASESNRECNQIILLTVRETKIEIDKIHRPKTSKGFTECFE
jgi:integrase/recombinase XerD